MHEAATPATTADLVELVELYRAYLAELGPERGGALYAISAALSEPLEAGFAAMLADDRRLVLLGTVDKVPLGLCAAHLEATSDGSCLAVADVLYVVPDARGIGVGEVLVDAVVTWAARSGARGIDVAALPGMRASKNFLETSGFVARLLIMHRGLGDDERGSGAT